MSVGMERGIVEEYAPGRVPLRCKSPVRASFSASFALAALALPRWARPGRMCPRFHKIRDRAPEDDTPGSSILAACPPDTLPDGDVCVHLPGDAPSSDDALAAENAHRERTGRWTVYEQIPRRPDRPASYDAYRYPVPPGLPGGHFVVSGYDLDRPNDSQRRGRSLHATGHGGIDLPDAKGTPVRLVPLEHQVGDADVIFVGHLFGTSVVTRHTVREEGRLRLRPSFRPPRRGCPRPRRGRGSERRGARRLRGGHGLARAGSPSSRSAARPRRGGHRRTGADGRWRRRAGGRRHSCLRPAQRAPLAPRRVARAARRARMWWAAE